MSEPSRTVGTSGGCHGRPRWLRHEAAGATSPLVDSPQVDDGRDGAAEGPSGGPVDASTLALLLQFSPAALEKGGAEQEEGGGGRRRRRRGRMCSSRRRSFCWVGPGCRRCLLYAQIWMTICCHTIRSGKCARLLAVRVLRSRSLVMTSSRFLARPDADCVHLVKCDFLS